MSNFDTRFIKFLTLLLVLGLMSGLSSCQDSRTSAFEVQKNESIIGGQNVTITSQFSKKVIYLALGVTKKKTPNGYTISQTEVCTASAITTRILLTAAHCVKDMVPDQVYAVMTLNPWNHALNLNEWIVAEKIKIHENYINTPENIDNDLALIKLSKDISADRISQIANVEQTVDTNLSLVAIGYGLTTAQVSSNARENASSLYQVTKQVSLLNYVMKTVETFNFEDHHFQINQGDFKGICQGDSGGPGFIFDQEKKDFYILGVTSYISIMDNEKIQRDPTNRYNLCLGRGIYTNLLTYVDWLNRSVIELK